MEKNGGDFEMKRVKITVLKCTRNEFADQYGVEGLGKCPWHHEVDVFIFDREKPAGLCEDAWIALERYVFALSFGATEFWEGWLKEPGAVINCCNDGMRPVIFKLEALED